MPVNWADFVSIVQSNNRFLLTCHIRPDCDAVGSEIGLAHVLRSLGKSVTIVNGHETSAHIDFIDPEGEVKVIGEDVQVADLVDSFDVMMILDTSSWAQLGPMGDVVKQTNAKLLVIDHHIGGDELGAIEFKDSNAEATGRLIIDAAEALDVPLTMDIAVPLFAAIATDTGWFRFPSTTSETYRHVATLVDAGVVPAKVYHDLYERETLARVNLRGRIIERFESELDGQLLHTFVRKEDFQQTGALPSDTEDAINMGLAIAGSQVAVILVEQMDGGFKISFRSRCKLNCRDVAATFGGGGHAAAAGAFVNKTFEETQKAVLGEVRRAMGQL